MNIVLSRQLMLPRISYFPLHTEKINKHFLKYANEELAEEMWLEHDNQPLKWYKLNQIPWNHHCFDCFGGVKLSGFQGLSLPMYLRPHNPLTK